ncbi:MAG: ASKHA domain-containing protein [Spirochaetales bacterium]|nr:ASKHA domain-containing protein [Spirochaetales bacterium]
MNSTTLTIHDGNRVIKEMIQPGETLLDIIRGAFSIEIEAPCAGKGTCGKCRVTVVEGDLPEPNAFELKSLSPAELEKGVRLACQIIPESSLTVRVPETGTDAKIKESGGLPFTGEVDPYLRRLALHLDAGDLSDQRSYETRLLEALPAGTVLGHGIRKKMAELQNKSVYNITLTLCGEEITDIRESEGESASYAVAVDIGTTTVVAYLINLDSGERAATASAMNAQKSFGADVISRIEYIGEDPEKLSELQGKIVKQLESLTHQVLDKAGIGPDDLLGIVAAGNTTMMHILQGLSPQSIALAPFLPVSVESMILQPQEIGSNLPGHMRFILLPSLASYIGADIVAGILSTEMAASEDLSLLVDIGTNGEIVLGNRKRMISCSTAAGPAFEGANIRCGVAGIPGAVSAISGKGSEFAWETIPGAKTNGICGSGIIDMTAYLLKSGLADYTGRIQDESDWGENPPAGSEYLQETEEETRFVWGDPEQELFFGQKDLREVQLAKGSIAAGINTLIKEAGYEMEDIKNVYIAGGFGSYINKDSALDIGLLPEQLRGRIKSVGNSCGGGVVRCALSREELKKTEQIRSHCEYIELSSNQNFQEEYMMSMYFPEFD